MTSHPNDRAARVIGAGREHDTETPDIETSSETYFRTRFGGPFGAWLLEEQTRLAERLLAHVGSNTLAVLEVGGGHAQLTPILLRSGHRVTVQGSSLECFDRVRPVLATHPQEAAGCVSSLWRLPFGDRAFDLAVAVRLLAHVARWRELIAEMARVSRGFLLLEFARTAHPVARVADRAAFAVKRRIEGNTRPFFAYAEDTIAAELREHGFVPVASGGQFALPMMVHRLLRRARASESLERAMRRLGAGDGVRSPAMLLAERVGCAHRPSVHDPRGRTLR